MFFSEGSKKPEDPILLEEISRKLFRLKRKGFLS
jgi:hypothetical protein